MTLYLVLLLFHTAGQSLISDGIFAMLAKFIGRTPSECKNRLKPLFIMIIIQVLIYCKLLF